MHSIGILLFPDFQIMSLAIAAAFEMANKGLQKDAYKLKLISEQGGLIRSSIGFEVATEAMEQHKFDTLFVGAGVGVTQATEPVCLYLQSSLAWVRRLAAPCTAAFVVAQAGLLDGRKATTHWFYAQKLQQSYPAVKVEQDKIYLSDGPVWTSAGMTAAIDLAIALIEADHGVELARSVARKLVVYHQRAGGQSQFSTLIDLQPRSDRIQKALNFARKNLKSELSVEALAEAAHLSPRQFSRIFTAETGVPPAKAIEKLRVEMARLMMEESNHSLDVIATETGFGDRDRMRRSFLRIVGQVPQAMRRQVKV